MILKRLLLLKRYELLIALISYIISSIFTCFSYLSLSTDGQGDGRYGGIDQTSFKLLLPLIVFIVFLIVILVVLLHAE